MKRVNLIIKITILVIIAITSCQSLMQIERNQGEWIYGSGYKSSYFRYSEDRFSNPMENQDFCTRRNAKCLYSWFCSTCKCKRDGEDTFLSYEQGCLNYATTYNVLQESNCMRGTSTDGNVIEETIPLILISNLGRSYCYYEMKLPETVSSTGRCNATELAYFDNMYGKKTKLDEQYLRTFSITKKVGSSNLCLRCSSGTNCDYLKNLTGYILRLSITCTFTMAGKQKSVETCFTFILKGRNKLDEDSTTTTIPVIPTFNKGTLHVQRNEEYSQKSKDFYLSNDIFTNKDRHQEFCNEFDAVCQYSVNTCANCQCKREKYTFISYRHGCLNFKNTQETLQLKNSVMVKGYPDDIIFIQREAFKYGTCINLELPSTLSGNQDAWSCEIKSTKYINALNGAEEYTTRNPFTVKFSSIFKKNLCLQCKSFTCDLSMYSGMMMKLEIKCKKNITSSQIIDTCFAFKLDGQQSFNETYEEVNRNLRKSGLLEVERNKSQLMGTHDFFTNPKNDKEFCVKRLSVCESTECLKCKCFLESQTFLSYNHGCVNITKENDGYGFKNCIYNEKSLVKTNDFNRKRCIYLEKPQVLIQKSWSCDVDNLSYIEPVKGKVTRIAGNIPFQITSSKVSYHNDKFCLQCKDYACDVSYLSGRLLKLGIKCHFNETFSRSTCIGFKMEGKYATNATLATPFNAKKTDDGSSSSIIAGVSISVLLILIAIVVFIFIWRRKQNQKKSNNKTRNESHSERSGAKEMIQVHEYASVGACRSKQTPPMRTATTHEELNLYYNSADRTTDVNPIYCSTYDERALHSPEYRVLEGDIYAAETPASIMKEMTTENIYAEGDIYSEAENSHTSNVIPETICGEENTHIVTNDGVENPIYGMEDESNAPEYSRVENKMSEENDFYGNLSSLPPNQGLTDDSEYAVVIKKVK